MKQMLSRKLVCLSRAQLERMHELIDSQQRNWGGDLCLFTQFLKSELLTKVQPKPWLGFRAVVETAMPESRMTSNKRLGGWISELIRERQAVP